MDPKLAQGITRHLIRTLNTADQTPVGKSALFTHIARRAGAGQRFDPATVSALLAREAEDCRRLPTMLHVQVDRMRDRTPGRLFNCGFAHQTKLELSIAGHERFEEGWTFQLEVIEVGRRSVSCRHWNPPLAINEHVVTRLLERRYSDQSWTAESILPHLLEDLRDAALNCILTIGAVTSVKDLLVETRAVGGRPDTDLLDMNDIPVPVRGGVLLGTSALIGRSSLLDMAEIKIGRGRYTREEYRNILPWVPGLAMRTFVDDGRLTDGQLQALEPIRKSLAFLRGAAENDPEAPFGCPRAETSDRLPPLQTELIEALLESAPAFRHWSSRRVPSPVAASNVKTPLDESLRLVASQLPMVDQKFCSSVSFCSLLAQGGR